MKRFYIYSLILSGLLLLCTNCDGGDDLITMYDDIELKGQKLEGDYSTEEMEPDVLLYIREMYPEGTYGVSSEAGIYICLETKKMYPCCNNSIRSSIGIKDNIMVISLEEIIKPDIGLAAIGPASTAILLPENINKLVILHGKKENHYDVKVSKESIHFTPRKTSFITMEENNYFRRPANTFAFVCGTNKTNQHLRDDFLKLLSSSISLTPFTFKGKGVLPWVEESSGHWSDFPTLFFTYKDPADFDKAGELLHDFARKNLHWNDGVTMSIENYDGGYYYSWKVVPGPEE